MSSNDLCKACTLLEGLERGMANAAVVRVSLPRLQVFPNLHHYLSVQRRPIVVKVRYEPQALHKRICVRYRSFIYLLDPGLPFRSRHRHSTQSLFGPNSCHHPLEYARIVRECVSSMGV